LCLFHGVVGSSPMDFFNYTLNSGVFYHLRYFSKPCQVVLQYLLYVFMTFMSIVCYIIFMPQKPKYNLNTETSDPKSIGHRVATMRKSKGLTQNELGEKIGISQRLVSDYEVGRVKLSAEMLSHFTIALDITADELLGLKNNVDNTDKSQSLRLTRRMRELESLSEVKKKAILKTLDDLIRANS